MSTSKWELPPGTDYTVGENEPKRTTFFPIPPTTNFFPAILPNLNFWQLMVMRNQQIPFSVFKLLFKNRSPDEGLEPATLRLKVWCSTDWANRACVVKAVGMPEAVKNAKRENLLIGNRKTGAITSIAHLNYQLIQLAPLWASLSPWRQMLSLLIWSNNYFQLPCPVSSVGRASDF